MPRPSSPLADRTLPGLLLLWGAWEAFSLVSHAQGDSKLDPLVFGFGVPSVVLSLLGPSLHLLVRPRTMDDISRTMWRFFTGLALFGLLALLALALLLSFVDVDDMRYEKTFAEFGPQRVTALLARGLLFTRLWRTSTASA